MIHQRICPDFSFFWMLTCVGANPSCCVGGVRVFYDDIILKSSGCSIWFGMHQTWGAQMMSVLSVNSQNVQDFQRGALTSILNSSSSIDSSS